MSGHIICHMITVRRHALTDSKCINECQLIMQNKNPSRGSSLKIGSGPNKDSTRKANGCYLGQFILQGQVINMESHI